MFNDNFGVPKSVKLCVNVFFLNDLFHTFTFNCVCANTLFGFEFPRADNGTVVISFPFQVGVSPPIVMVDDCSRRNVFGYYRYQSVPVTFFNALEMTFYCVSFHHAKYPESFRRFSPIVFSFLSEHGFVYFDNVCRTVNCPAQYHASSRIWNGTPQALVIAHQHGVRYFRQHLLCLLYRNIDSIKIEQHCLLLQVQFASL